MINARIVKKTGFGVRDAVYFEATSTQDITQDAAKETQAKLGYIPAGYGFENFKVERCSVLLRYKATWKCQASCD